ncbi:MAG: hypothetical protein V4684_18010 [Pseudomonadota bacterium]
MLDPDGLRGVQSMRRALILAVSAAIAIKIPALFGVAFDPDASLFYPLNISFFTLPFVAAYFVWERSISGVARLLLAATFALAAGVVNAFPFLSASANAPAQTHALAMLHLPFAMWFVVGVAFTAGRWRGSDRRMDFIRFTGEFFVHFVLVALGGGVLVALTFALFQAIGLDAGSLIRDWIVPCGIAGAAVIVTWLVDSKQGAAQNMAPVLARIFTPLFVLVLLSFIVTMAGAGRSIDARREILIAINLLLIVVSGLLLYVISARDPLAPPGLFDWLALSLVTSALLVDFIALGSIGARISQLGFTPNRLAALGLNLVLLVNLAACAIVYAAFIRRRQPFVRLCAWQMDYLAVIAGWAAIVVFAFPALFGFV